MRKNTSQSGGTGCGWILALLAMAFLFISLYLGVGMSADLVTDGAMGVGQEFESIGILTLILGVVALILARKEKR